jgi:DNA-binding response OmpR family regulator
MSAVVMTGTLLVVDDDPDFRALYEAWLAAYEVRVAADGAEALDVIDEAVDVVVLDREMPRKDGITVARELQARAVDPAVVMVSGVAPDTDLLDVPVDDYLRKPVEREAVTAAVRRGLAVTDSPDHVRDLLALDTRIDLVEDHVDAATLDESHAYQQATSALESRLTTLSTSQAAVFDVEDATGASRDRRSVRKSP